MNQENNSFENLHPSQDDVQIQIEAEVSISAGTITSTTSSSILTTPKTARDKFFKDLQYETEKKDGVTSNFTRHARECHKQAFDIWVRELNESKSVSSTKSVNKITNHFEKTSRSSHSTYNANHPRQMELLMGVVKNLIIKLGLPLSIVERPAFIKFMETVDPKFVLTSRRTLTRTTIPLLYEKMHDQLKMFCSTATFLSLALDVWSDRRLRSFCVITAHAIINGTFKSYVLDFVPLWGSHNGSLLLQTYEEIVNRFGIKDKVIRLFTDSSSNNISAFKNLIIPGFEEYFINDDDNEITEEDSDTEVNDETHSDEYEYEYDDSKNISSTASNSTTTESTQDIMENSFRNLFDNNEVFRIPCFAHTIQLVVADGLKEAQSILLSLGKVSTIAKLSQTNTKFAEKLELMKVSIPRAIIIRWNSQFLMVERILAIPTLTLNEILIQLKYKHLCFNSHDLDVLNEFICLLSLIAEVTTKIQQENSPSISLIAPSILAIYSDLKKEKNNIHYTNVLCDALLSSLLSRFGGLLEQLQIDLNETGVDFKENKRFYNLYEDPVFLFTPFLDGMFKLGWITKSSLPDPAKEQICEKIKQLILDQSMVIKHANDKSVPVDAELIEELQQTSSEKKPVDQRKFIKEEIAHYLEDNDYDSMVLLRLTTSISYETLSKLATKYLCIPATSAAVERIFSQSGFIFRSHRARMSRKTLQQLTLLKCNSEN
ncbi:unnamed protein product [Rotaria magnacalcarata]|uniref:HAT C-terminal dimerisation domain-containing protein n=1 Tax=Rotaria magnacalcarata TaxID=392030 RepID=A0A8S2KQI7_9BILA|nr:unnamed protein product [Rotaria magnacalcarata]